MHLTPPGYPYAAFTQHEARLLAFNKWSFSLLSRLLNCCVGASLTRHVLAGDTRCLRGDVRPYAGLPRLLHREGLQSYHMSSFADIYSVIHPFIHLLCFDAHFGSTCDGLLGQYSKPQHQPNS